MEILETNQNLNDRYLIAKCNDQLMNGQAAVLLLPIGTIYGLVCRWNDEEAKKRMFMMKKKNRSKAFQMFASDVDMLLTCGIRLSKPAKKLAAEFCPGSITIIDKNEDRGEIAFRIPDEGFMQNLIDSIEEPLAVISAGKTATSADTALRNCGTKPDTVVDIGIIPETITPATVVEVSPEDNSYRMLREGTVSEQQIKDLLKA